MFIGSVTWPIAKDFRGRRQRVISVKDARRQKLVLFMFLA
jgi:hypothetical protein